MGNKTASAQRKLWDELEKLTSNVPRFNSRGQVLEFVPQKDIEEINRCLNDDESFRHAVALSVGSMASRRDYSSKSSTYHESLLSVSFENQYGARIYIGPGET